LSKVGWSGGLRPEFSSADGIPELPSAITGCRSGFQRGPDSRLDAMRDRLSALKPLKACGIGALLFGMNSAASTFNSQSNSGRREEIRDTRPFEARFAVRSSIIADSKDAVQAGKRRAEGMVRKTVPTPVSSTR